MSATPPTAKPLSDPRRRVYKTGDFLVAYETVRPTPMYTGEKLACVTFRMTPGQVHKPHSHAGSLYFVSAASSGFQMPRLTRVILSDLNRPPLLKGSSANQA